MQKCQIRSRSTESQPQVKLWSKNDNGTYQCNQCPKSFKQLVNFYRHNKDAHLNPKAKKPKKIFMCVVCDKEFRKRSHYLRHTLTHEKQLLKCQKCAKTYKRVDHFQKHVDECNPENVEHQPLGNEEWANSLLQMLPESDVTDNETVDSDDSSMYDFTRFSPDDADLFPDEVAVPDMNDAALPDAHRDAVPDVDTLVTVPDVDAHPDVGAPIAVPDFDASVAFPDVDPVHRNTVRKRSRSLADALENIQRLHAEDQARVFRNAAAQSKNNVLETVLMTNVQSNEAKLLNGLFNHLKNSNLYRKDNKSKFCSLLWGICGESLTDDNFVLWLSTKLDMRKERLQNHIQSWLTTTTEPLDMRGKKGLSQETQQLIVDAWLKESMITVDRRSGRDQVVMKRELFIQKFGNLRFPEDIVIEEFTSKRNQLMVRTTRRIAIKTFKEMNALLKVKHNLDVSSGSIFKYKPFFIQTATEREKECCLCKVCLNIRLKYRALVHHLKEGVEKTDSLTSYFGYGIKCPMGENGYYQDQCISGLCEEQGCSAETVKYSLADFKVPEKIDYQQFVKEGYTYISKKTKEKKEGSRTVRKVFTESFESLKENFDSMGSSYLHHRFEIKNDQYLWPLVLNETQHGYVFHMDFSENIQCTPKEEPQDAHFSSKQTSLHCTVVHSPHSNRKEFLYAYHLSDDKLHDASFTESVTRDLLMRHPDYKDYPLLRIKSDNCSTQYCCLHVFRRYLDLSKEIGKPVILYYGVNGHGRGLVDAMSGFGVKSPLRRKIVTEDFFFETADELCEFLQETFSDDDTKTYTTISTVNLQKLRRKTNGVPIDGCQKARMIALLPDGTFQLRQRLCICEFCSIGKFDQCVAGGDPKNKSGVYYEKLENEFRELDETDDVFPGDEFVYTEPGNYIALYSATNFEQFYLFLVDKKVSGEDTIEAKADIHGHYVEVGDDHFEGFYLEKVRENKDFVFYKQIKKRVFVHPESMFCADVPFDKDNLSIKKIDYVRLCQNI